MPNRAVSGADYSVIFPGEQRFIILDRNATVSPTPTACDGKEAYQHYLNTLAFVTMSAVRSTSPDR